VGYAYTENPKTQPVSLVADVLHSWVEYWDVEKKVWKPIDPTWGSTSGISYFDSLDTKHIAFVKHGSDPELPLPPGSYKLGDNPQKDVHVSLSQLDNEYQSKIDINIKTHTRSLINDYVTYEVYNSGNISENDLNIKLIFDDIIVDEHFVQKLPPKARVNLKFKTPIVKTLTNYPDTIKIKVNDIQKEIKTQKFNFYINKIFLFLSMIILFVVSVLFIYKFIQKRKISSYEKF
jgi:hypothetical protein